MNVIWPMMKMIENKVDNYAEKVIFLRKTYDTKYNVKNFHHSRYREFIGGISKNISDRTDQE